jgi:hypothetical protein
LVELVAGLVQPADFFFHRLNLHTKLLNLADMFVVALCHGRFSFSQPLRNVRDGISERPESTRTFFLARHGATRRKRNPLLNREVLVCADSITRSRGGQPDGGILQRDGYA